MTHVFETLTDILSWYDVGDTIPLITDCSKPSHDTRLLLLESGCDLDWCLGGGQQEGKVECLHEFVCLVRRKKNGEMTWP